MAEEAGKAVWESRQAGQSGRQGGVAARWGEGMDLLSKECSGVNIVTKNLRRIFNYFRGILDLI